MTQLLLLILAIGAVPLLIGMALTARQPPKLSGQAIPGSILLCALAFNLVFFWQELWLVIPKALTPGLHPVLYHNNHDWTGDAPIVELLQGSGAVATLVIGFLFTAILMARPRLGTTMRLFCFWMAFQGLTQSLSQLVVGTLLPGNDVGRALAYLGVGSIGDAGLLLVAIVALAASGRLLAFVFPSDEPSVPSKPAIGAGIVLASAFCSIVLIIPFRVPRNPIETALIPLIVNLIGAGWTILGFARLRNSSGRNATLKIGRLGPALWLAALLLVFQLVLRPGIRF